MRAPCTERSAGLPLSPPLPRLQACFQAELPEDFMPRDAEGVHFQRAFTGAGIADFDTGCIIVTEDGQRVTVAPAFMMRFSLATMLPPGWLKRVLGGVSFRVACVGHPSADLGHIDGDTRPEVLAAITATLERLAPLVAYKGFGPDLTLPRFVRVRGLPVPVLSLQTDPFAAMNSKHRNQIKRKRRQSEHLQWQTVSALPPELVAPVYALYLQTYERAQVQFEKLTPGYFEQTANLSEYLLAFDGDKLVGFAQLMAGQGRMLFKYVGMDYACAKPWGLYFGLLIRMVEHARASGHQALDFGVTAYDFKRKLGAQLQETFVYYRHTHRVLNYVLRLAAPLLEPGAEELL